MKGINQIPWICTQKKKKNPTDYLAPKCIYNSLYGAPENVPCITVLSDLWFKKSLVNRHWNSVTSSLAALAMSKAHCITCWVLNGRSRSGSRSPMIPSWHSSCRRAALDVSKFKAWRTVLILGFCKRYCSFVFDECRFGSI